MWSLLGFKVLDWSSNYDDVIRGNVIGWWSGSGVMVLNVNIFVDIFISYRYILKEVVLNLRIFNICGKINYIYISEILFVWFGKRLVFISLVK